MHPASRTPLALLALLAAIAASVAVAVWLGAGPALLALDTHLYQRLSAPPGNEGVHEIVRDITAMGSLTVLGLLTASGATFLAAAGRRGDALLLVAVVVGGTALTFLLKDWVARPRPPPPDGAPEVSSLSFPSAHASLTLIVYGAGAAAVLSAARSRLAAAYTTLLALLLVALIGASRVYLGVHYPGDVLGGWWLGGTWLLIGAVARQQLIRTGAIAAPRHPPAGGL